MSRNLNGQFKIEPPLESIHLAYLDRFSLINNDNLVIEFGGVHLEIR